MRLIVTAVFALALVAPIAAQDTKAQEKKDDCCGGAAAVKHPQFEKLKALVGTWESSVKDAPFTVTYRLTAGGSALVETISPGTEHEMLTVYTVDGDDLILTHYCVLGNAPRMKAERESKDGAIRFACSGGSIKCDKVTHMHSAAITIKDKDTLSAAWSMSTEGKATDPLVLNLARKK
jgi:hypothetical protein